MAKIAAQSNQAVLNAPPDDVFAGGCTAAAGAAGEADGTGLCTARLTDSLLLSSAPPAVADTASSWIPPAEGGTVMRSRICESRACAACLNAAETAALSPTATTLPWLADARLVSTDVCVSVVLKPTT